MNWLNAAEILPDIIFLDMNMPCKNGAECLAEIREIDRLKNIPIVIISTSLEESLIKSLYENGAQWYIKKPHLFSHLKLLIANVIELVKKGNSTLPTLEKFMLTVENK
jgi:CheY-like chemotaxis protein